nr:MAG TPA: hypothetical protein [Caudoviricetes sp.]
MASFHVTRSVPSFIHRQRMPASMSSLSTAIANRVSESTASMRETISPRLAFVAAFAPVLHEGVEFVHVHVVDGIEGAVVGFVGGALENPPGEVFIVEAVSLGAAAVADGDDGVNWRQSDVVAVSGGVVKPVVGWLSVFLGVLLCSHMKQFPRLERVYDFAVSPWPCIP